MMFVCACRLERVNVLSVFALTMLLVLSGLNIVKHWYVLSTSHAIFVCHHCAPVNASSLCGAVQSVSLTLQL